MSVSWNPWHGCQRVSEGCRECYVYRQDAAWQKDGGHVVKTTAFSLPVRRSRDGRWKIPAGEMVFTCFTSDFLLAEADVWRRVTIPSFGCMLSPVIFSAQSHSTSDLLRTLLMNGCF